MEHALDGLCMGASVAAAAAALSLLLLTAGYYGKLLDALAVKMQQNPVVVEESYE